MKSFLLGLFGVLFGLTAWHIKEDHDALHALINMVNSQIAASQRGNPNAPAK